MLSDPEAPLHIIEPCFDDEARGVLFEVGVDGRRAQGYVSLALLEVVAARPLDAEGALAAYRRHQAAIDTAVARRAPAEDWETVMLRREDLVPCARGPTT